MPQTSQTSLLLHNKGLVLGLLYSIAANENMDAGNRIKASALYLSHYDPSDPETPTSTPPADQFGPLVRMGSDEPEARGL